MENNLLKDAIDNLDAEATHMRISGYENAGDCLDRFLSVLDDEPLKSLLQQVLPEIDFQDWEDDQQNVDRGMGHGTLHWPKNLDERVATQLAFFKSGEPQNVIMHLLIEYFYETNFPISYHQFINQFFDPFFFDLSRVIQKAIKENTMPDAINDKSNTRQLSQVDPKKVFVVYGRNKKARDAMFTFLRSISLEPLEWLHAASMTSSGSPYVGEILENAFNQVQAFVVLLSGDDEARLREPFQNEADEDYEKELTPQARPNVLFEAGLAFGTQPRRVVLVELGKLRPFSDTYGRYIVRIDNNINSRQQLAILLRNAGCEVNLDATDWYTAGDFESIDNITLPKHSSFKSAVSENPLISQARSEFEIMSKSFDETSAPQKLVVRFTNRSINNIIRVEKVKYSGNSLGLPSTSILTSYRKESQGYYLIDAPNLDVMPGADFLVEVCLAQQWKREDIERVAGSWGYLRVDIIYRNQAMEIFNSI